jgi:hypothetical protein
VRKTTWRRTEKGPDLEMGPQHDRTAPVRGREGEGERGRGRKVGKQKGRKAEKQISSRPAGRRPEKHGGCRNTRLNWGMSDRADVREVCGFVTYQFQGVGIRRQAGQLAQIMTLEPHTGIE